MTAARARIYDLIDADASSPRYCGHSIGRVIEGKVNGAPAYVHVQRIERSGERVWGIGRMVSAVQAEKLQTRWDIRWGFRQAPQPAPDTPAYRAGGRGAKTRFSDVDGAASAIVSAGYRELAKRHHPDAGGDHNSMSLLTQAHKQLKTIIEMAKG